MDKTLSIVLVVIMVAVIGIVAVSCGKSSEKYNKVTHLFNKVMETEVYTEVDEDFAYEQLAKKFDAYFEGGGCTAVGKTTKQDGLVIGRNMDFYITDKPSYVVKTDVPGRKKTFGLTYSNTMGDELDVVQEKGVKDSFYKMIPFMSTDVMNEDGFYIEINMRNADYDESGNTVFACKGTNPGKKRLISFALPYYLGSRCSTVVEAVKMAKEELDLYTPSQESGMDWNFCFMLADATGKFGVLEIAKDKVVFNEAIEKGGEMPHGACQANFYITPEFNKIQKMKAGVGRYDFVSDKWASIETEDRMYAVMLGISYFQSYFPYCMFDNRSEFVGIYDEDGKIFIGSKTPDEVDGEKVVWDYDFVTNPKNKKYVDAYIKYINGRLTSRRSDDTMDTYGAYWESTFTLTANPKNKTMFVRFNENNKDLYFFDFNEWK